MKKKKKKKKRRGGEGVVSGMENEMDIPSVCALRPARHVRREEGEKRKENKPFLYEAHWVDCAVRAFSSDLIPHHVVCSARLS